MPKGKAKTKYDFTIDPKTGKTGGCKYSNNSWCNLPKYKRCLHCLRCIDGSKVCEIEI